MEEEKPAKKDDKVKKDKRIWLEKYRPKTLEEVEGNEKTI